MGDAGGYRFCVPLGGEWDDRHDFLCHVLVEAGPAPDLRLTYERQTCVDPVVDARNGIDRIPPTAQLFGRGSEQRQVTASELGAGEEVHEEVGAVEIVLDTRMRQAH